MRYLSILVLAFAQAAAGKTVRYTCPAGETLTVNYESARVVVTLAGKPRIALAKQGTTYSDGYTVFSGKDGEVMLEAGTITLKGCTEGTPVTLTGKWLLVELEGKAVSTLPRPPDIEFQAEGRAAGSGGCNRFTTGYKVTGKTLQFGRIASTRMACLAADAMEWEDRYLDALQKTASFQRSGSELVLLGAKGETLGRLRSAAAR
jgi:heat shock protein HslJ